MVAKNMISCTSLTPRAASRFSASIGGIWKTPKSTPRPRSHSVTMPVKGIASVAR